MLTPSRRLIMKIVCVFNICKESIIINSFEELINDDILNFHSDDCLLADTLFDLLNHLDTYTTPAATPPQVTSTRKAIHPFFLPFPPLQSPSRRPSFRLSIPRHCVRRHCIRLHHTSAHHVRPHHVYLHPLLPRLQFHLTHRMRLSQLLFC